MLNQNGITVSDISINNPEDICKINRFKLFPFFIEFNGHFINIWNVTQILKDEYFDIDTGSTFVDVKLPYLIHIEFLGNDMQTSSHFKDYSTKEERNKEFDNLIKMISDKSLEIQYLGGSR